jgi:hypothetical protein
MLDSLDTLIAFIVIMLVVSMLITVCVQMFSAALNLRGQYLGQGLSHTFGTILPGLWNGERAQKLACRILSGRLLSDSKLGDPDSANSALNDFRRCATAVRPDEVFDALHRIATERNPKYSDLADDARALLKGLGVSDAVLDAAKAEVAAATGQSLPQAVGEAERMMNAAKQTLAGLPDAQRTAVEAALKPLADRLNTFEAKAAATAVDVAGALEEACKKFKYWFEVSQERAQQWFTTHTRWLTVILAVVFAFGLQLDTVEIFKLVSSNKAARDKLVAQVGAVTGEAEKIVGDGPKVLQEALETWRKGLTDNAVKEAVKSVAATLTDSRGALRARIDSALGNNPDKPALLDSFETAVDKTAQKKLDEGAQDYSSLKTRLDDTGFKLFVTEPGGRWHNGWFVDTPHHLLGVLFSVALLSLGAPFWFNALKSLANLRSRVAQNISTEQEGEKAPPGSTVVPAPAAAKGPVVPVVRPAAPATLR